MLGSLSTERALPLAPTHSHAELAQLRRAGRPGHAQSRRRAVGRVLNYTATGTMNEHDLRRKTDEYNRSLQRGMHWDHHSHLRYNPERGINLHRIVPGLYCGSQPRTMSDIEQLRDRDGIEVILNLQQDRDMRHWDVKVDKLKWRAGELDMQYLRYPAVDFDQESLRKVLPNAVRAVAKSFAAGKRVYVHCTAGLGRAPAVCIAYLYWFREWQLDEAYGHVTHIRPCGPKRDAVRAATFDLLDHRGWGEFHRLPHDAFAFMNKDDRARAQDRVLTWM